VPCLRCSPCNGKTVRAEAIVLAFALGLCGCGDGGETHDDLDLLIHGGVVVDGTGVVGYRADVAIRDGRVVEIGDLTGRTATRRLDASGRVVTPGFVDLHSHADLILLAPPARQSELLGAKLRQGVTTVVVGNCGLGVAPANADAAAILAPVNRWMTPDGVQGAPGSTGAYLETIERSGVVLNVATLVPHGPVRISAMGLEDGRPTEEQLERMLQAVERSLAEGAFGLSVGLIYPPGMYSDTDELVELARVVAREDRLFTAHVRGSSETLLDATTELVSIARQSGARVHHSHMEAVGEPFWSSIAPMIEIEDRARAEGLRISHDVFPYTRAATMMTAIFPPWALEGGMPALLSRLRDPASREAIRREIADRRPSWPPWVAGGWPHNLVGAVGWGGIVVSSLSGENADRIVGRSLAALAAEADEDPFDLVVELMLEREGAVGQQVMEISGDPGRIDGLLRILQHPAAAIVSDAEDYGRGAPHPAHAGAFAKAFRLNRELALMPLETLVHRMTGYPASLLGLADRGVVRVGAAADLVVLDPARVTDRADWLAPRLAARGIDYVVLNGTTVVTGPDLADGAYGVVLRAGSELSAGSSTARLSRRGSPSGVSASTRAIRAAAVPSP